MKTRVYAIDLYELHDTMPNSDEEFIDIAEGQGNVWTLEGFEKAFNNGFISASWIIRIISPKTSE